MDYRREVDGLRALAVLPVIFFHAGIQVFSGGFVGVDVFFVISGYLITSIILGDIELGRFSIVDFYERRARRILPALFVVMLACIPFAWVWLMPADMARFADSVLAVCVFSSNVLFWRESGYFGTAAELKPLLHTWSLAVEEQYYVLFPILLSLAGKLARPAVLALITATAGVSLWAAQLAIKANPAGAFYLLPTRAWELLFGGVAAFYLSKRGRPPLPRWTYELGGMVGTSLLAFAIFSYDKHTPFPGAYALIPVGGTVLIVLLVDKNTVVGKLLGSRVLVGVGLVSYSAYLWHQPLFAFARHKSPTGLGGHLVAGLVLATFLLAYVSWKFVETPFRNRTMFNRKTIFGLSAMGAMFFVTFGVIGHQTSGFQSRFDIALLPKPWDSIKCHGKDAISRYKDPVRECLGKTGNKKGGDIYLIGDSHAAQLTFPLRELASERGRNLHFINTELPTDFPYSFWATESVKDDRILEHLITTADAGDLLLIAFHRGQLNEERDAHLPRSVAVADTAKSRAFSSNMRSYLPRLVGAGLMVYLVKDGPLLLETASLEKCALRWADGEPDFCALPLSQDLQTRSRQTKVFDALAADYPEQVISIDVLPPLYGGKDTFNPIYPDGSYKMFDRHHLTAKAALELLPYMRESLR